MREIEIRRHSCTRKGPDRERGAQLSSEGVKLAREIGAEMGEFDLVLTSKIPRTLETALAMGFSVDGHFSPPADITDEAIAVIGHLERWSWTEPWVRFAELVREGGPVATFGNWFRSTWVDALESISDGGRVLIISHGRDIEAGVVACLSHMEAAGFSTWGEPLHQCEGVRFIYDQATFSDPRVLRTRRCGKA